MALDLSKLRERRSSSRKPEENRDSRSASPAVAPVRNKPSWHGRDAPPPPPGSGWDAFLDWASGGALDPWPEDVVVAFRLWSGHDGQPEEQDVPKGP